MSELEKHELEIACQQILLPDASVYSVQWIDLPAPFISPVKPSFLLQHYFTVVGKCTLGLIRPFSNAEGVQFRVLGTRFALLTFAPPRFEADRAGEAVHLYIGGGFLVQARDCDRGMFSLLCTSRDGGVRITVQLSDYCPLLLGGRTPSRMRRLLYRLTQAYFHKVVTVRYLCSLYRELTGVKPRAGVKKVQVREGTEI